MLLYHGSNMVVARPEIRQGLRAMDFGPAFYTTSSKEQAMRWARSVARIRRKGTPTVNIYELDEQFIHTLCIQKFETATEEWLDFVVENRKFKYSGISYDLVIGPIANDTTIKVIDYYMEGTYTKQEAINHLLPQNLKDQFAFLTEKALSFLTYREHEIHV